MGNYPLLTATQPQARTIERRCFCYTTNMPLEQVKLPVTEAPELGHAIGEGGVAVAEYPTDGLGPTHLTSEGFRDCKGITIYDSDAKRGLLAHIAEAPDPEETLRAIIEAYGGDLLNSDIHIVHTRQLESNNSAGFYEKNWPDTQTITDFFMKHSPKSIRVDANEDQHPQRSIALNLQDEAVTQYDGVAGRAESQPPNVSVSRPIHPHPKLDHTKFSF